MIAGNSAPIRVFLINSQRCVLWGLERLIESRQPAMQVVGCAGSCAGAFEQIAAAAADLILLDVDLGNDDSSAAIPELKARSRAKILVLTGSRDASLHDRVVLAGASGVVRKESPAQTILAAIDKVHAGQLWLDRLTIGRIFGEISKIRSAQELDPEQVKIASLTDREREVVTLAANRPGANGQTLAQMLNISEHTLRNHFTSIYNKLNVSNRLAMSAYAYKHGLILTSSVSQRESHRASAVARRTDREAGTNIAVEAGTAQLAGASTLRSVNGKSKFKITD